MTVTLCGSDSGRSSALQPALRRLLIGGCAAAASLSLGGTALAAAGGYGGRPAAPGAPGGFTSVVTARTVGSRGGTVKVSYARGTSLQVRVPRGASTRPLQVVVTRGSDRAVRSLLVRSLSRRLHRYRVVAAFAVLLRSGSAAASTRRDVVVTLSSRAIRRGETIVVYNGRTHHFQRARVRLSKGRFTIGLRAGEAIAVLS